MKLNILILFLLIIMLGIPAFAQSAAQLPAQNAGQEEISDNEEENIEIEIVDDDPDSIFVINSYKYNISGLTIPNILNKKIEIKTGEEITGRLNFENYIKDKTQLIINERVLENDPRIEYVISEIHEDGKYYVDLVIYAKDTWNIIALPYPKYSSNYGLEVSIKARDYNFLGTMESLRVDLGYKNDQNNRSSYKVMVDTDFPFTIFGYDWNFNFDHWIEYRAKPVPEDRYVDPETNDWLHLYYRNTTGLSVVIPIKRSRLNIGFSESFIVNEENADSDKAYWGEFQKGLYMSSNPYISWWIPTALNVGNYGELCYSPSVSATINHEIGPWELLAYRVGPFYSFNHSLSFGRINWKGNLREGFSSYINNSISYNSYNERVGGEPWGYYYGVQGIGHFILIKDKLGFSSRINYRHWIKSGHDHAGDDLRGISDKNIYAELMLSANLDLRIRALQVLPSTWEPDVRLFRILNFDFFINPIFDIAYYKPYNIDADNNNLAYSGGLEFIIYPHRMRSMFFRISAAWDLTKIPDLNLKDHLELFFGMEYHY